jgi:Predicted pPIWI-associating nuclease
LTTRPNATLVEQLSALGRREEFSIFERARSANSSTLSILNEIGPRISAVESINAVSLSWRKEIENFQRFKSVRDASLESVLGVHLTRITERTLLAQGAVASISRQDIGGAIATTIDARNALQNGFDSFAKSYSQLFQSFEQPRTSILTLHPRLSELSSVEFFNGADLLRATSLVSEPEDEFEEDRQYVREEISEEIAEVLPVLLSKLNPKLLRLWEGATHARRSSNPDRIRHFATSLRELMTHVMHELSPDDEIRGWSTSTTDFANNRPTRKARLRFIAREINHGPFTDFIEKDIQATLATFNLFHAGTHVIESSLTEAQLAALQAKVESALYFMILTARGDEETSH